MPVRRNVLLCNFETTRSQKEANTPSLLEVTAICLVLFLYTCKCLALNELFSWNRRHKFRVHFSSLQIMFGMEIFL